MTDNNSSALNKRKGMPLVNVRVPELYLGLIDELVKESESEVSQLSKELGYPNRCAFFRVAIKELLIAEGKLPDIKGAKKIG